MPIDLRSDTMTRPCAAMREAMAAANVGDDVWGEDPTAIALQTRVAALLGKEAAIFVPSGTMANQIALLVHCRPGDEVILAPGSHCIEYEGGAAGLLSGVQFRTVGTNGSFDARQVTAAIRAPNVHHPPSTLLWIENTHNGVVFPQAQLDDAAAAARARGLSVHLDGARLLNAAAALGREVRELVASVDSASICLSKGLGAPVGSVLAGSDAFVAQALRRRKMLGGGMRQIGHLAAAGLYALEHNVVRLAEDHANARTFAEGIAAAAGVAVDVASVETNIVMFDVTREDLDAAAVIAACAERDVLLCPIGLRRLRAVTHLDVDAAGCARAAAVVAEVVGG